MDSNRNHRSNSKAQGAATWHRQDGIGEVMAEFPLVRPEVPDAQKNRGPDLLLEGLRTGLAAFAQFAQIRRQTESEVARLAFAERQAQTAHDLDKRKLDMAAEMIPYQQKLIESQADMATEHAKAYAEGTATSAQLKIESTKQKNLLLKEVADQARTLKLDDAHFQTKEPMAFAKNVIEFGRMYHLSPLPEVRKAIKDYQSVADSQKLFIKHGIEDESGNVKATGSGRNVPAWRIVMNAVDPTTRDQTLRDLRASGYTEIVQGFQDFSNKDGTKVSVPTKSETLRQPVKQYVEEAQGMESLATSDPAAVVAPAPTTEPAPMPDYGPDADTPQYPVGTRGKRGGQWFVLTEEGWKPE